MWRQAGVVEKLNTGRLPVGRHTERDDEALYLALATDALDRAADLVRVDAPAVGLVVL